MPFVMDWVAPDLFICSPIQLSPASTRPPSAIPATAPKGPPKHVPIAAPTALPAPNFTSADPPVTTAAAVFCAPSPTGV